MQGNTFIKTEKNSSSIEFGDYSRGQLRHAKVHDIVAEVVVQPVQRQDYTEPISPSSYELEILGKEIHLQNNAGRELSPYSLRIKKPKLVEVQQ